MVGMAPSIWGPMMWRILHGFSYIIAEKHTPRASRHLFCIFLIYVSKVLPCAHCRESYTKFLKYIINSGDLEHLIHEDIQKLVYDIHNMVNQKLEKTCIPDLEIVKRRSKIWKTEAIDDEIFGILFIVALNFNSNGEKDKKYNYMNFFMLIPNLLCAMGYHSMAESLGRNLHDDMCTQDEYVDAVFNSMKCWSRLMDRKIPSRNILIDMYSLCKSQ